MTDTKLTYSQRLKLTLQRILDGLSPSDRAESEAVINSLAEKVIASMPKEASAFSAKDFAQSLKTHMGENEGSMIQTPGAYVSAGYKVSGVPKFVPVAALTMFNSITDSMRTRHNPGGAAAPNMRIQRTVGVAPFAAYPHTITLQEASGGFRESALFAIEANIPADTPFAELKVNAVWTPMGASGTGPDALTVPQTLRVNASAPGNERANRSLYLLMPTLEPYEGGQTHVRARVENLKDGVGPVVNAGETLSSGPGNGTIFIVGDVVDNTMGLDEVLFALFYASHGVLGPIKAFAERVTG